MSYRELRNCAEMLRALGFRRLISVENFRSPNFQLVAEILAWLVYRLDPKADLPTDTDTEQDRIIFIRSVAQFMASKAHVKLNTKRLYQSDGYAVQELLKGLTILYAAVGEDPSQDDNGNTTPTLNFDVSNKISELKQIRSLASEITGRGATLYDLLRREVDLRETRTAIINRQLELTEVETGIKGAIQSCDEELKRHQSAIENVDSDQANLEAKIEKKKTGLERGQKRLLTLKKVRPAFMDEYEKLEHDLKRQYNTFVQNFVSLSYLENQLDDHDRQEQEKMAERESATRKLLERLRTEENRLGSVGDDSDLTDSDEDDDSDDDDDDDHNPVLKGGVVAAAKDDPPPPPKQVAVGRKSAGRGRQVFGSMTGDVDSESLDSDTDLNLEGVGDSDLDVADGDLGDPGDLLGGAGGPPPQRGPKLKGNRMRAAAAPPDDQDDF